MAGIWILPEYNIIDITGGSVTSEAAGYPLTNIYDEYKKPWKTWRSTSLVAQTITLNFTGGMNAITFFNCNFETVIIDGRMHHLGYESGIVEWRGLCFENFTDSITFTIPMQATLGGKSYYYIGSTIVGTLTNLIKPIKVPYMKRLINPIKVNTLESGQIQKLKTGRSYHRITIDRNSIPSISTLNQIKEINRRLGKTGVIVFYEGEGEKDKTYLCRRVSNLSYTENFSKGWSENWEFEEIV